MHDVTVADGVLTCGVDPDAMDGLLRRLTDVGVRSLTASPPTLEELFLDVYRKSPR